MHEVKKYYFAYSLAEMNPNRLFRRSEDDEDA